MCWRMKQNGSFVKELPTIDQGKPALVPLRKRDCWLRSDFFVIIVKTEVIMFKNSNTARKI